MPKVKSKDEVRNKIFELTELYYELEHSKKEFVPGKTKVAYSGRVFDSEELKYGVDSILKYWLTSGEYTQKFEENMKNYFKASSSLLVNSGSSANLLMMSTLCSNNINNHLNPGDEVITPAVTFPTTLTPIIQNNLVPVFVDCQIGEYNIDINLIEDAISDKTRCIFIPHTVGIPANMDAIMKIVDKYNLFFLEDGCDCLGATWDNKLMGTFGDMSSISFLSSSSYDHG